MTATDLAILNTQPYKYAPRGQYSPERRCYLSPTTRGQVYTVPSRTYRLTALTGWPARLARVEATGLRGIEEAGVWLAALRGLRALGGRR